MGEVVDTRWKLASGGNSGGIGRLDWWREKRGSGWVGGFCTKEGERNWS